MEQKLGFKSGFGGGAIVVAVITLIYIFGGGQNPQEATEKSVKQVYEVAMKGDKLCEELKTIDSMTEEQKKTIIEAEETFEKVINETKMIAGLLNIDLEKVEENHIE